MSTTSLTAIPGFIAGTWDIDASHSDVAFTVRHLVITKVRGRFDDVTGSIVTTDDLATAGVEVVIGLNSINTNSEQRDGHLKSADFFETETYPEMTYKATGVRPDGDKYVLDGELSLKGVTRTVPVTFELNGFSPDPWGGTRIGLSGDASINRRDFGVNFEGVQNGLAVVADKIDIHLEIEAVLRQG
ncbi:YceI family protein [Actinokineospora xionganensis]|uniref:YceI family protein n=1 Tax=Actinokineospora xionganensis TaxID=2684470 RepID=A0ABR7L7F6_9PSEU|nr:YceI family protein [Actinokineospora xionganensis]MBC6448622.1 YceI family protein [Actinokineospora xionganensis]